MTNTDEVILISHPVHDAIDEDEMRAVIPSTWVVRACVEIKPARLTLEETRHADWYALARVQEQQWRDGARPCLEKYPTAWIAYFGLAPIPLALHLGTLAERWVASSVFLRHHVTRKWHYVGGERVLVHGPAGPRELTNSTEPVIVTVSTTAPADIQAARERVGATSAEIEIRTEPLGEDVLGSEEDVKAVAARFQRALELLEANRPGVSEVHLSGAIPVGLAFLLGTHLTPTRHARIVTYQYHRSHEPRLVEALRLPFRSSPAAQLTSDERSDARFLREEWEAQRSAVAKFVCRPEAGNAWSDIVGKLGTPFRGAFACLEVARTTPITSAIDLDVAQVDGGFRFERGTKRWHLGDELLCAIRARVAKQSLARAGRMLLLHEALHHGHQNLTAETARMIRLAPKVLEELDYSADVWAMIHEFAFLGLVTESWETQRKELLQIVADAVDTMWAFDADREPGVLEVRRVNRYLIWYANLVRLEQASKIEDAMTILASKPVIELVGPEVGLRDDRLVAFLARPAVRPSELCFVDQKGRLRRCGNTNAASVAAVARALGAHDGVGMRTAVRAFLTEET